MSERKNPEGVVPGSARDHIGQQLRAVYDVGGGAKPRFLGDEGAQPEAFAEQVERLEARLKTHEEGTGAVEQALDKILDAFGVPPDEVEPAGK